MLNRVVWEKSPASLVDRVCDSNVPDIQEHFFYPDTNFKDKNISFSERIDAEFFEDENITFLEQEQIHFSNDENIQFLQNKTIQFLELLDVLGFTPDNCIISGSVGCICYGMNHRNTDLDITTTLEKFNQLLAAGLIHKQKDNGQKVFYTDAQNIVDISVPRTNTSYSNRPWEWCMAHSTIMNINGSNYRISDLAFLRHIYGLCMEKHPSTKHQQRIEWLDEQISKSKCCTFNKILDHTNGR